jgi:hypothetical protein
MNFKTQAEIYQALLDGKKIRESSWTTEYVYLKNGVLVCQEDYRMTYGFADCSKWSIYEEPKPKKQVWQWRYKDEYATHYHLSGYLMTEEDAAFTFSRGRYEKHAGPFEVEAE